MVAVRTSRRRFSWWVTHSKSAAHADGIKMAAFYKRGLRLNTLPFEPSETVLHNEYEKCRTGHMLLLRET